MKKIEKPNEFGNLVSFKRNDDIFIMEDMTNTIINSYYINAFQGDEKIITKFIKHVESKFRSSDQYSAYLGYLKSEYNLKKCAILGNIDDDNATIELHHYPLYLYEICEILLIDAFKKQEQINSFILINKLLNLHYKNLVGLVPLSKTIHELVHSGQIFIPLNKNYVFGNYDKFLEKYKYAISTELIDKINNAKLYTKDLEEDNSINNLDIIDIKLIKLIENDVESPKTIEIKKEINQIA